MKKIISIIIATIIMTAALSGCSKAERATYNVQKEADYFNVERRLSVINARTDKPMLELTGYFSLSNDSASELVITSEVSEGKYKVDYVYLNDWTLYVVEDISGADVDPYHYELVYQPEMILPFEVKGDNGKTATSEGDTSS